MSCTYAALGAGWQGIAIAYDMAPNGDAATVLRAVIHHPLYGTPLVVPPLDREAGPDGW